MAASRAPPMSQIERDSLLEIVKKYIKTVEDKSTQKGKGIYKKQIVSAIILTKVTF